MSLKDFKIISKLGQGSYSTTFKAERAQDGIEYALKKINLNNLPDAELENALNEIRILASVNHPNIIGFKQAFIENNTLCLIMEFADDGDLYQRVIQHKRNGVYLQESLIWNIFINILSSLRALHSLNVLHRDLKSANVYLTKDEGAKLGDLNSAKIVKNGQLQIQYGSTPYYASPQIWKNEPYDSKSDMWSLGCVLYEMATLRPPFRAQDMQGLYSSVMKGVYPKIQNSYSVQLSNIIKYLLQQNQNYRPSAENLLNSLEVKKKIHQYGIKLETDTESHLLKTIKISRNYNQLTEKLPKSNYKQKTISHGKLNKSFQNYYQQSTLQKYQMLPKIGNNANQKQSSVKRKNKMGNLNLLEIAGHSKVLQPSKLQRKGLNNSTIRQNQTNSPKKQLNHKIQINKHHQIKIFSLPPVEN